MNYVVLCMHVQYTHVRNTALVYKSHKCDLTNDMFTYECSKVRAVGSKLKVVRLLIKIDFHIYVGILFHN